MVQAPITAHANLRPGIGPYRPLAMPRPSCWDAGGRSGESWEWCCNGEGALSNDSLNRNIPCAVLSRSVMLDSATARTIVRQASLSMAILQARMLEWDALPSSKGSAHPGIKSRSPASQVDSLPSEPPGKPTKHTHNLVNSLQFTYKDTHSLCHTVL